MKILSNECTYEVIVPTWCRNLEYFQDMMYSLLKQDIPPKTVHIVYDVTYITSKNRLDLYRLFNHFLWSLSTNTTIKESVSKRLWSSAARNTWIWELSWENNWYVFFCDDDDERYPNKVTEQIRAANNTNLPIWIIWTNFREIDQNWLYVRTSWYPLKKKDIYKHNWCPFKTSTIMMDKKYLLESWGFNERYRVSQDTEFFYRFMGKYHDLEYQNLSEVLVDYRTYPENISHEKWFQQRINSLEAYILHRYPKHITEVLPFLIASTKKTLSLCMTPKLRKVYLKNLRR